MKRVVVTGMASITALGDNWADFKSALIKGENAVKRMQNWEYIDNLNTN
ncbi:MAG: beta-ketoacyl synthase N-terminal-like domain-containing protein, partial [Pseudoalteromonas sp.]